MVQIAPGAQGSGPPTPCLVPCALLLCAVLAAPAGLAPSVRHVLAERPAPTHKPRVATGARPNPTPVIAMLGEQRDASGRYYSTLSPYSMVAPWPVQFQSTLRGQSIDQFGSDQEHVAVITARNRGHWSSAQARAYIVQQIRDAAGTPSNGPTVRVATQETALVLVTSGSMAEALAVFTTPDRLWAIQLVNPVRRSVPDLGLFLQVLRTFRLEQRS